MKSKLLSAIVALGLLGLCQGNVQATTTNGLLSAFSMVGVSYPTNSPVTITNAHGNVITSTYTTKPFTFTGQNVLNLIQAEFGTIFPRGARIAYSLDTSGFVVLDSKGNFILNAAANAADSNYSFVLSNGVAGGVISGKTVMTTTATSTNTVEIITEHVPDYGLYYEDGKSNKFHFTGIVTVKANALVTPTNTFYRSASLQLNGSGGGSIFNPTTGKFDQAVFTVATWFASGVNIPQ
jgi:hypothetical protein